MIGKELVSEVNADINKAAPEIASMLRIVLSNRIVDERDAYRAKALGLQCRIVRDTGAAACGTCTLQRAGVDYCPDVVASVDACCDADGERELRQLHDVARAARKRCRS